MSTLIIQLRRKFSLLQKLIATVLNCKIFCQELSSVVLLSYCTLICFQIISLPDCIIIHGQIYCMSDYSWIARGTLLQISTLTTVKLKFCSVRRNKVFYWKYTEGKLESRNCNSPLSKHSSLIFWKEVFSLIWISLLLLPIYRLTTSRLFQFMPTF